MVAYFETRPDSDSKKIRTREKHGPGKNLDLTFENQDSKQKKSKFKIRNNDSVYKNGKVFAKV